jgi:uncharacterized protein YkwD
MRLRRAIASATAITLVLAPVATSGGFAATTLARTLAPVPMAPAEWLDAQGVAPASGPAWLARENRYRSLAGLGGVGAKAKWSHGDQLHARYEVKNDTIGHSEDSGNRWYTAAGATAAANSNVMVSSSTATTDSQAIDMWMSGPFHAVGIIDPHLRTSGYGSYRKADGGYEMAAALDVLRGLGSVPASVHFPVKYPSGAGALPIRTYTGNEFPNPLTSCSGYAAPTGVPIILEIGDGSVTPHVTAHSLKVGGKAVTSCEIDETNYRNPDSGDQSLVRAILGARDAIVVMARKPLRAGKTYTVSITANGHTTTWSFRVAANAY